jgi:hypothetical protein
MFGDCAWKLLRFLEKGIQRLDAQAFLKYWFLIDDEPAVFVH